MSKQFRFYATKIDLVAGLARIRQVLELNYADAWLHEDVSIPVFDDLSRWQGLGENSSGRSAGAGFFLAVKSTESLKMKTVKMDNGGVKFKYEPHANTNSVVLQPSGIYRKSDPQLLVCGMCGTALRNAESVDLYNQFRKAFLRDFSKRSDGSYLGPDAASKLAAGELELK